MESNDIQPTCGMANCGKVATRADSTGVGYCDDCADIDTGPIGEDWPIDPWWKAAVIAEASGNSAAWEGLEYGEYPPGSEPR